MKDFIEKSGLRAAQFAKKYDIPYNTVRQWAEGIRKAPTWLVKIFEAEQAYKPLIEENYKYKNMYLFAIIHVKTNSTTYSRVIDSEEYKNIKDNYWYVEYIIKNKGYRANFYLLNLFDYKEGEKK